MEITSASEQKIEFLNLMVAELRNQNPLEPMDHQQMAAQLAQFTQLQLAEEMNTNIASMNASMNKLNMSFQGAMLVAEFDYAKSLLGKDVTFYSHEYQQSVTGQARKMIIDPASGKTKLEVSGKVRLPGGEMSDEMTFGVDVYQVSEILM
ncbi:MAG TPA: flagellar hook capping FlgD N-terminal domain-containing protein [Anaerohalosphaeraceae bacterium]|jgi:flagellar hook assembly protein FlgD|nr:flagellar hook capping FlgD N-terminal domain-containing protein [Anaerohalosphaeraceae bacterium]HRT49474.1 flagellar hook capping FlgD N-terminal domain-containing protein [Anaerohalosphaeraceae bacterium]HRT85362.1 flagellar hook capping FlgD N-terminal domain-containing protein [Anaerohalosphaeraceae bacterium]